MQKWLFEIDWALTFSCLNRLKILISRRVLWQYVWCSKGLIFLIATRCPVLLSFAELKNFEKESFNMQCRDENVERCRMACKLLFELVFKTNAKFLTTPFHMHPLQCKISCYIVVLHRRSVHVQAPLCLGPPPSWFSSIE